MDKLRALQYFAVAARERSFSGAARRFEVSPTAVAKLVTALEKSLGIRLFERSATGLSLTASGAGYLEACAPALETIDDADELARAASVRAKGLVVAGVQHVIADVVLAPALPRFHQRYPDITLDIRDYNRATEDQRQGVDVFLVLGWPEVGDLVHRHLAAGRFIVVSAPAYWAAHGRPQRPTELERHNCLVIRGVHGTAMDLWTFRRGSEEEAVTARGWLIASNAHRDRAIGLALAGEGVVRVLDWMVREELASGRLVQVLEDWESLEAPPVNLMYRASARRIARVRAFVSFVVDVFREMETARGYRIQSSARPDWIRAPDGSASRRLAARRR